MISYGKVYTIWHSFPTLSDTIEICCNLSIIGAENELQTVKTLIRLLL